MKIFTSDNAELMEVKSLERSGNTLIIKGKIYGAMPMTAKVSPQEARNALKLLNLRMVLFLITLLFRR